MRNKRVDWKVIACAIVAITTMEIAALSHGLNGTLLTLSIAAVAGLGGWILPGPKLR